MNFDTYYKNQVELLLSLFPAINDVGCFALKGGTAINLFIRDMPRLSVDIDLTYLPIEPRTEFLLNINAAMENLVTQIENNLTGRAQVERILSKKSMQISKLLVRSNGVDVKIEPNLIFRGSVFDCEEMSLCQQAQEEFLLNVKTNLMSLADIYAGKICATLNRQHPRDLFDIKLLFDNEGITEKIRKAFVVHLACDARPMSELLKPNLFDITSAFINEFQGMTVQHISLDELIEVRQRLISEINLTLTDKERYFLLSIKLGDPDWSMLDLDIQDLPALKWKLLNIKKIEKRKHKIAADKLKKILGL